LIMVYVFYLKFFHYVNTFLRFLKCHFKET